MDGEVGGNSCVTWTVSTAHQTCIMDTGSARVTKFQPMPMPTQTHSLNLHGFTNLGHSLPIYDGCQCKGCPAFDFSMKHFKNLSSWPFCKNPQHEKNNVPLGASVTVGYTIGTYSTGSQSVRCISPNIQFVILLAISCCESPNDENN